MCHPERSRRISSPAAKVRCHRPHSSVILSPQAQDLSLASLQQRSVAPAGSLSTAHSRCHLERSREISAPVAANVRGGVHLRVSSRRRRDLGLPHSHASMPAPDVYRRARTPAARERDPSCRRMTAKGGRYLEALRPVRPRSLDFARDDTRVGRHFARAGVETRSFDSAWDGTRGWTPARTDAVGEQGPSTSLSRSATVGWMPARTMWLRDEILRQAQDDTRGGGHRAADAA